MAESPAKIRPVILSGGSGTRLWPISRHQYPKQFAPLIGEESLFTATLRRVANRARYAAPIIVGNIEHKFFILETLDQLGITDATVLLEPKARNTAAACIIAALAEPEADMLHLVLPSDHLIADEDAFHRAVAVAAETAKPGNIVLFGIRPTRPETGYGYISPGADIGNTVRRIAHFSEKPDGDRAQALIEEGALWNSGMFVYAANTFRKEAGALSPQHYDHCSAAWDTAEPDGYGNSIILGKKAYAAMENHAFDTLIMEHTKRGAVLACAMGWDDIGSWHALWQLASKDSDNNALVGSVIAKEVKDSYVRSDGPMVAMLGMESCMVIATKDVVMVAPCSRAQEIKGLLSVVENSHRQIATTHTSVSRPWGTYERVAHGRNFQVKHVIVKPGRALSLQMHHHRAEHWVVVAGTAKVECDGVEKLVFPNESVFVPTGAMHRLSNPGKIDLQLIEVQSGEYLSEDDIIRFDDRYGRVSDTQQTLLPEPL